MAEFEIGETYPSMSGHYFTLIALDHSGSGFYAHLEGDPDRVLRFTADGRAHGRPNMDLISNDWLPISAPVIASAIRAAALDRSSPDLPREKFRSFLAGGIAEWLRQRGQKP